MERMPPNDLTQNTEQVKEEVQVIFFLQYMIEFFHLKPIWALQDLIFNSASNDIERFAHRCSITA